MREVVWSSGGCAAVSARALRSVSLLAITGLLTICTSSAEAQNRRQAPIRMSLPEIGTTVVHGGPARPVAAWSEFCTRMPSECRVDPREPALVTLTPANWARIIEVNRRVNAKIKPVTDQAHWGIVDRWDYPDDGRGDCEDIQLLKRRLLVNLGLPRRALLMTVVIDDIGEGHAVLTVRTDRGDFVLDNKTSTVLPWQRTGYDFVKREGQDGRSWVAISNGASPVATANR